MYWFASQVENCHHWTTKSLCWLVLGLLRGQDSLYEVISPGNNFQALVVSVFPITCSLKRKAELPALEEVWRQLPEFMPRVLGYRKFLNFSCGLRETSGNLGQPLMLPDLEKNQFFLSVFLAVQWILKSIWLSCHRDCSSYTPSFTEQVVVGF